MKPTTLLLFSLFSLLNVNAGSGENVEPAAKSADSATFDFATVEKMMAREHDQIARGMPAEVRKEILESKAVDFPQGLSRESQAWIHHNLNQPRDPKIGRELEKLVELRCGDDLFQILSETYWCRLRSQPLELEKKVRSIGEYWAEQDARRERLEKQNKNAQQDSGGDP